MPTFFEFAGPDRVAEQRAKEFAEKGNEVTVFTFAASIKPEKFRLKVLGLPKNAFLHWLYRLFFPLDFIKTLKILQELKKFDIIEAHVYPMSWLAMLAKKFYGKKFVFYNYGIAYPELYPSFKERIYMRLFRLFTNLSIQNADKVISISNFLRKELIKEADLNSEINYCQIDKKRFNKKAKGGKLIRKKFGIKKNAPLILSVGRVVPHKGVHLLVQAFNLLKKKMPEARLMVVGNQSIKKYFQQVKKAGSPDIIFTGPLPDELMPACYAACDVYASASLWEGFNLPLVEAQACGKPVVAFYCCAHPEVVKKGTLVEPKNIELFAQALEKILRRQRK